MIYYFCYNQSGEFDGFKCREIHGNDIPLTSIKVNEELWQELLKDTYKVNLDALFNLENKVLSLGDKDLLFSKINMEGENTPIIPDINKETVKEIAKLKIENKVKDLMLKSLTKEFIQSNITNKKKDAMLMTLSKTVNDINIKFNKLGGIQ